MKREIYTLKQLSEYLQVSDRTLERAIANGELTCSRVGNRYRFHHDFHIVPYLNGERPNQPDQVEKSAPATLVETGPLQHVTH